MDEEIPPLPEGWTPERVSSTDPRTIAALPDEIYLPIRDWNIVMGRRAMAEHQARLDAQNAEINAKRIAAGLKTQDELDLEFTLRMGMPESQLHTTLWDVAKVMDQNGDQAWGFVVVKTWGYGADGPRWSQYWTSLSAKIEGLLRDAGVGPDGDIHSGIAGKFRMVLIEDENALDGANEAAVQDYLGPLLHSDDEDSYDRFPEGVNRDIVLVVTEKASNSLLSPRGKTPPWLMAVLMEGDELEEEDDDDDDGPRVRSWKTSIDWLIELWQSLQRQPPDELEAFEGKIWQGFLDEADDEAEDGV